MQFRSLALTIVSAAAMSFFACGSDSSGTNRESDSSSGTASSSSVTSAASSADASTVTTADLSANMTVGTMFGDTRRFRRCERTLYALVHQGGQNYGYAVCKARISPAHRCRSSQASAVSVPLRIRPAKNRFALASGVTVKFPKAGSALRVSRERRNCRGCHQVLFQGTAGFISKASALEGKNFLVLGDYSVTSIRNGFYFPHGPHHRRSLEAGYYDVQQQWLILVPKYYKTDGSLSHAPVCNNVSTSVQTVRFGHVTGIAYDGTDFSGLSGCFQTCDDLDRAWNQIPAGRLF